MKDLWWKILAILILLYTIIWGFLGDVPRMHILNESIRNTYFHIPMWWGMILILTGSMIFSIRYLAGSKTRNDIIASEAANTGLVLGFLGLFTGMLWARYTWGAWWVADTKLNGAAITILIYLAYLILRGSIEDDQKKAKVSAVYNIFAYVMLIVFLMVLPRMNASLHPGNGGNPGFGQYDMDSQMRMVFYPAVIGWTLLGVWIMSLRVRIKEIKMKMLYA